MNAHEVPEPILNSPFEEPEAHWWITEFDPPERRAGRRPAMYFLKFRDSLTEMDSRYPLSRAQASRE